MEKAKLMDEHLVLYEINTIVANGNEIYAIAENIHRDFTVFAINLATRY